MCDLKHDLLYGPVRESHRSISKLNKELGIGGWIEKETDEGIKNPGRAIGKAAGMAASMYLGGALGGAGGGAGGAAGSAAAPAAGEAASLTAQELATMTAEELAKYYAEQAALYAPEGLANTMEAGLVDTGYTPSSLFNAARYGPGSGQGMGQTMQNYGSGLMNKVSSPGFRQEFARKNAMRQGVGLMNQPQQQQPAPRMPPPQQQPMQPMPMPYTSMEEEEKRRLRMMYGI